MQGESDKFPGFPPEMRRQFWMYPRVMDAYWHQLSGSEQKVLDFILRRTWGWEKWSDSVSLSQIQKGGGGLGNGTGLSLRQIITATRGLEKKGFIRVKRLQGQTNEFSLVVQEVHRGGEKSDSGSGALTAQVGSAKITHTVDNVPIEEAIEKMYRLYSHFVRPGQRLTREAKRNITSRFGEYHPKQLVASMKNVVENDYWENIVRSNSIGWFFASEERIAQFLALGPYDGSESKKSK